MNWTKIKVSEDDSKTLEMQISGYILEYIN